MENKKIIEILCALQRILENYPKEIGIRFLKRIIGELKKKIWKIKLFLSDVLSEKILFLKNHWRWKNKIILKNCCKFNVNVL